MSVFSGGAGHAIPPPPVGGMATEGPLAPAPAWLPGCFVLFLTRSRWPASLPRSLFGSAFVFGAVLKPFGFRSACFGVSLVL